MRRLAVFVLAAFLAAAAPAVAAPKVAVSQPPLHSLVAALMNGVATPDLVGVESDLSGYDAVFWVGPAFEAGLAPKVAAVSGRVMAFLDQGEQLNLLPMPGSNGDEDGPVDPYFWMDARNARVVAFLAADLLSDVDPDNANAYRDNAQDLIARAMRLDRQAEFRIFETKGPAYAVLGEGFQYFGWAFGLTPAVRVPALGPDDGPAVKPQLVGHHVGCVLYEARVPAEAAEAARQGTGIVAQRFESLGGGRPLGPELYFAMMEANIEAVATCLGQAGAGG